MADAADIAAAYQQRLNEHARREHKAGPVECQRCGYRNDREGYALCSECVGEGR